MKPRHTTVVKVLLILTLVLAAVPAIASAAEGKQYVCPPCDLACDKEVFDAPGRCPRCNMALVERPSGQPAADARPKAAILIFEGVQIIDYTGPYEVFGQAGFKTFTVAESRTPIKTAMGMTVVPEHTFEDAPQAEVLVVPGGGIGSALSSAATLAFVRERSAAATQTLSVCNGAFILAKAGLLDGLGATTFYGLIDDLKAEAPKTRVVSDKRFVDNGRIVTTAGLSSGIDGSLHVVSKLRGMGRAQAAALNMEYDWRPDSGYARAALADRLMPALDLGEGSTLTPLRTEGDTRHWDIAVIVTTGLGTEGLLKKVDEAFAAATWKSIGAGAAAGGKTSDWKRTAPDGAPWTGRLTFEPDPKQKDHYTLSLSIRRGA